MSVVNDAEVDQFFEDWCGLDLEGNWPEDEDLEPHPRPQWRRVIAVAWNGADLPSPLMPTYTYTRDIWTMGLWVLRNPVEVEQTRALNTWAMVTAQLVNGLDGQQPTRLPNPITPHDQQSLIGEALTRTGDTWRLAVLRAKAWDAGFRDTWTDEGRRRGGEMTSEKKKIASAANAVKARAGAAQKTAERDRRVLALVGQGLTEEQMAQRLDIAPSSVPTTIARARRRQGQAIPREPLPRPTSTARTAEADRLDLDALVAMAEGR